MRNTIFITIGCLLTLLMGCKYDEPSIGTNQYPFIAEGKTWNCCRDDHNFSCKMIGNTTIKSKVYKKVYLQDYEVYNNNSWHYFCAVRENGKQVFMVEMEDKKESLLYDFGI